MVTATVESRDRADAWSVAGRGHESGGNPHNVMRRTLLGGLLLVAAAFFTVLVGGWLDLELDAVAVLGVAAGAVVALVPDATVGRRLAGFALGVVAAVLGYYVRAALTPDTSMGRAVVRRPRRRALRRRGRGECRPAAALVGPARCRHLRGHLRVDLLLRAAAGRRPVHRCPHDVGAVRRRRLRRRRASPAPIAPQRRSEHRADATTTTTTTPTSRWRPPSEDLREAPPRTPSEPASPRWRWPRRRPPPARTPRPTATSTSSTPRPSRSTSTPDGSIESQRVYEQLTLTGTGTADLANPIENEGLRNLNGFDSPEVEDGVQIFEVDVDGDERSARSATTTASCRSTSRSSTASTASWSSPATSSAPTASSRCSTPSSNITAEPQEVTFPDGQGGTVTETVDVPIPMVGSLTTVVPATFTEVTSEQANMAGDGKGGTKLSFTMTLFPPIGSDTAEFGYTAEITDGVVPSSSVSALPVNPLESPSFKTAGDSYQSGSDTGVRLAEGATEIDANLLKLRAGAAELLGGLIKLPDGADQLSTGLSGEAAPGARKLADGAGELDAGLGKIDEGAGKLADGAQLARAGGGQLADGAGALNAGLITLADGSGQVADGAGRLSAGAVKLDDGAGELRAGAKKLSAGTGDALTGSEKLEAGLQQISGGLGQLADNTSGLPKALRGAQALKAGVDEIIAGVGSTTDAPTASLLGGLQALETGLTTAEGGSAAILAGLRDQLRPGIAQAKGGVDQVQGGLASAVSAGGSLDQLSGAWRDSRHSATRMRRSACPPSRPSRPGSPPARRTSPLPTPGCCKCRPVSALRSGRSTPS